MCAVGDSRQSGHRHTLVSSTKRAHTRRASAAAKTERRLVFRLTHPPGVSRYVSDTGQKRSRARRRVDRRRRHLRYRGRACPHDTATPQEFAILEARGATGGTWDLFRYPGIRSDSDLHTFGYEFKPWQNEKAIAGADAILDYLRETASEYGIDRKIRFHHKVRNAAWSRRRAAGSSRSSGPTPASS